MRRKAPTYFPNWTTHSVLDDSDPLRLQLIGAIALQWNFVEDILDECLKVVLGIDPSFGTDVTSRINGMDGKTSILLKIVAANKVLTEAEKKTIKIAIDGVSECKKYRDGIIHARIGSPTVDVAFTAPNRGDAYYIIVANQALSRVYDRLDALGTELVGCYRMLELCCFPEWEISDGDVDLEQLRASPGFLDGRALALEHQSRRLSLPPLPRFADQPQAPKETEGEK